MKIAALLLICCWTVAGSAFAVEVPSTAVEGFGAGPAAAMQSAVLDEDAVNLRCLRTAYPQITGLEADPDGRSFLLFADGRRVLYRASEGTVFVDPWDVDVRTAMSESYPLEPERPATPAGVAPGRRRSHELLAALYGTGPAAVLGKLETGFLLGQAIRLSGPAAQALNSVNIILQPQVAAQPETGVWLKSDGGFAWRRIAGETRLSPHSFGIALDVSANRAAYWRWSKLRPHPLQQSYPSAVVQAFEEQGFIWGGKWHEYDLMHYEYRPELICKARLMRDMHNTR